MKNKGGTVGRRIAALSVTVAMLLVMLGSFPSPVAAQDAPQAAEGYRPDAPSEALLAERRADLAGRASGDVRIERDRTSGFVDFIGTSPDSAIEVDTVPPPAASVPEATARAFVASQADVLGLSDVQAELRVLPEVRAEEGTTVRFQQFVSGIPVVGGELIVQLDQADAIRALLADVSPNASVDPTPSLSADQAVEQARIAVARKYEAEADALGVTAPELWVYDPEVLGDPGLPVTRLVWRLEVTGSTPDGPVQELVLVDADTGAIALQFNQITDGLDRRVCDAENTATNYPCAAPYARAEGEAPTGIEDVDQAYGYSGDHYQFFFTRFGRDSLDDAGYPLISTVRYCDPNRPCPYQNAFWDGDQTVFGQDFVTQDIVGHEWGHGMDAFTSQLFYYYQAGAIDESLADVWGEFIDLTTAGGDDSAGVRWLVGEDLPIANPAIRDMADPPAYNDPDRIGSDLYKTGEGDNGGVHSNSGVNNKAVSLLVDGGSFNGFNFTGIGIEKVAALYYNTQIQLLVSGSDYNDLYNALVQTCSNLLGTVMTSADCTETQQALQAVEMDTTLTAALPAADAAICASGSDPVNVFYDDMEAPSTGNWTTTGGWEYSSGYASQGELSLYGRNFPSAGITTIAMSDRVSVPAGGLLHFSQAFDFDQEAGITYDGGVVEYSVDGGANWTDAGALFVDNGYNGTIESGPLAGRNGYVDRSGGYTAARADLASLAGEQVQLRFSISADNAVGDLGWLVDQFRIYSCQVQEPPEPLSFVPTDPCAVFDTRSASGDLAGRLDGGETRTFQLTGSVPAQQGGSGCAAPPPTAVAVELNLIAVGPTAPGNLRVAKAGVVPIGGVVNFLADQNNSNSVPVEVTADGRIDVTANGRGADVVFVRGVVLGYYERVADNAPGALSFIPTTPCAVFDTRSASGDLAGRLDGGETRRFRVAGTIPEGQGSGNCEAPPSSAVAVAINLVAVAPTGGGNLRISEAGVEPPQGGVVNFVAQTNNSNEIPVQLSADQVDVNVRSGGTDLVHVRGVVVGYYEPQAIAAASALSFVPTAPCAVFDTRHASGALSGRLDGAETRTFQVSGSIPTNQGGGGCANPPATAVAVVLNLVAVRPQEGGNLQVAEAGMEPGGGVVNFVAGLTNSSAVPVEVSSAELIDVTVVSGDTDVVDVRGVTLGYFLPAEM